MKIINISQDSSALMTLLAEAKEDNLLLRTADGSEFILAEVDNFDRELELTRQNLELMAFLDERAKEQSTLSAAEVRAELGL